MDTMKILELVVGPAVIAAIISGIISFFVAKKERSLKYITDERKKWREEIRIIVEELVEADHEKVLMVLAKLKVRINAFGIVQDYYSKDSHIWEVISKIEHERLGEEELLVLKRQLMEYLSLLLKLDWEKSKKEVRGTLFNVIKWLCFAVSIIVLWIAIFSSVLNAGILSGIFISTVLTIIGHLMIVYMFICSRAFMEFEIKNRHGINTRDDAKKDFGWLCALIVLLGIAFIGITCHVFLHTSFMSDAGKILVITIDVLAIIFHLADIFEFGTQLHIYCTAIEEVRRKYEILMQNEKKSVGLEREKSGSKKERQKSSIRMSNEDSRKR